MNFRVLVHKTKEGLYWAEVPALPGCIAEGETVEEIRANIRDAIAGWLITEDDAAAGTPADEVIKVVV